MSAFVGADTVQQAERPQGGDVFPDAAIGKPRPNAQPFRRDPFVRADFHKDRNHVRPCILPDAGRYRRGRPFPDFLRTFRSFPCIFRGFPCTFRGFPCIFLGFLCTFRDRTVAGHPEFLWVDAQFGHSGAAGAKVRRRSRRRRRRSRRPRSRTRTPIRCIPPRTTPSVRAVASRARQRFVPVLRLSCRNLRYGADSSTPRRAVALERRLPSAFGEPRSGETGPSGGAACRAPEGPRVCRPHAIVFRPFASPPKSSTTSRGSTLRGARRSLDPF